jgi:hypothetical protein
MDIYHGHSEYLSKAPVKSPVEGSTRMRKRVNTKRREKEIEMWIFGFWIFDGQQLVGVENIG